MGYLPLHKLMFQIIANGSYNLTTYSTATVLIHSLPIAKALHITSLRIFLPAISQLRIYQVVFLFFALAQNGAEKRKTTAALAQTFTMLASYKHPSQSILQRCIAMRLARPTIAFLPLPVLRNSRLYICRAWGSLRCHAHAAWTNNARNCRRPVLVIGPWRQVLPLWPTLGQRPVYLLICSGSLNRVISNISARNAQATILPAPGRDSRIIIAALWRSPPNILRSSALVSLILPQRNSYSSTCWLRVHQFACDIQLSQSLEQSLVPTAARPTNTML